MGHQEPTNVKRLCGGGLANMANVKRNSSVFHSIRNYLRRIGRVQIFEGIHAAVCGVVLIIAALSDWPYFMYVLLRLFICGSAIYLAIKLYSRHSVPLTWLFGAIGALFNPILPVKMSKADWETTNGIIAAVFIGFCLFLVWNGLFRRGQMRNSYNVSEAVLEAAKVCEELDGHDTRILKLSPDDSSPSDYFVVTSAPDRRKARVLEEVVKGRLLNGYGLDVTLNDDGAKWILLDYLDFTVHIFVGDARNFYDIEKSRTSAVSFTVPEFQKGFRMKPRGS